MFPYSRGMQRNFRYQDQFSVIRIRVLTDHLIHRRIGQIGLSQVERPRHWVVTIATLLLPPVGSVNHRRSKAMAGWGATAKTLLLGSALLLNWAPLAQEARDDAGKSPKIRATITL